MDANKEYAQHRRQTNDDLEKHIFYPFVDLRSIHFFGFYVLPKNASINAKKPNNLICLHYTELYGVSCV